MPKAPTPETTELHAQHLQLQLQHQRLKHRVWSGGLVAMAFVLGSVFSQGVVNTASAGLADGFKADVKAMNAVLRNLASILAAVNTKDNLQAMNQIDDLINEAQVALIDDKHGVSGAVRELRTEMQQMNYNMYIMTSNMQRMSNTVTPAMGRMDNIMRWMPVP